MFNLRSPEFKIKDLLKERWYSQGNSAHVSLEVGVVTDGGHGSGAG